MGSTAEFACMCAALALQDDGKQVTEDKIQAMLGAAGVVVEPFWPGLYAKALCGVDIMSFIAGSTVAAAAAAAKPEAVAKTEVSAAPAKEEKLKEAVKEESEDEDMGFGLFD